MRLSCLTPLILIPSAPAPLPPPVPPKKKTIYTHDGYEYHPGSYFPTFRGTYPVPVLRYAPTTMTTTKKRQTRRKPHPPAVPGTSHPMQKRKSQPVRVGIGASGSLIAKQMKKTRSKSKSVHVRAAPPMKRAQPLPKYKRNSPPPIELPGLPSFAVYLD